MVLSVLLLLALVTAIGVSEAQGQSSEEGQSLFQSKCAACHSLGGGDKLGPDLKDVAELRDADWLARFVAAPDQVIASGDPIAAELVSKYTIKMPNLGLTDTEVASLVAYLQTQVSATPDSQPTPAPTMIPAATNTATDTVIDAVTQPSGNTAIGKDLFTGVARFQRGGPACMSCHGARDLGALGGGALGPDLTGVHARLGDAAVTWPEIYSPMKEVYSTKPLTQGEKDDLLAFFKSVPAGQSQSGLTLRLTLVAVVGTVLLLGLAHLVWSHRLGGVRRAMVARQTSPFRNILGG